MSNYNKVLLMGNLTRDVEMRTTQGGMEIAKFGMAINRRYTKGGQTEETTCFVDCTAFGRTAEVIHKHLGKGDPIFVDGRLEFSTWESQDGGKRSKLEVLVESFQFLPRGGKDGGDSQDRSRGERRGGGRSTQPQTSSDDDYDGYIPF